MNNFDSIDRLMEFGLGLGMGQQMIRVMNETMSNMYVPGSAATIPKPPSSISVYAAFDGRPSGPYDENQFRELVTRHVVTKSTLVWQPGMATWEPVESVPAILKIIALAPPPLPKHP